MIKIRVYFKKFLRGQFTKDALLVYDYVRDN